MKKISLIAVLMSIMIMAASAFSTLIMMAEQIIKATNSKLKTFFIRILHLARFITFHAKNVYVKPSIIRLYYICYML